MDLAQPIPGMQQAIDPRIPADVRAIMAQSAGQKTYNYNGAFYFTDEDNPRNVKARLTQFMPRLGLAWSLDDKTAVRVGYGRFYTPQMLVDQNDTMGQLESRGVQPCHLGAARSSGRAAGAALEPVSAGSHASPTASDTGPTRGSATTCGGTSISSGPRSAIA